MIAPIFKSTGPGNASYVETITGTQIRILNVYTSCVKECMAFDDETMGLLAALLKPLAESHVSQLWIECS